MLDEALARFTNPQAAHAALTTTEVALYPQRFEGDSRKSLAPNMLPIDFSGGTFPVVSANMLPCTGRRMARALALCGGLPILPQDRPFDQQLEIIGEVKAADTWCGKALTVSPDDTIYAARKHIGIHAARLAVVVENGKPVGVFTAEDLANKADATLIAHAMTENLTVIPHGVDLEDAMNILVRQGKHAAPVVRKDGSLVGVISEEDILLRSFLGPALDTQGRLLIGAAVGITGNSVERTAQLLQAGVDVIVIDTAHGHQRKCLQTIRAVRNILPEGFPLVAGNVCTPEGVEDLVAAGANIIKVGVGPGGTCTTRMVTGHGRPQLTAVLDCVVRARALGAYVWADGGVRNERDFDILLGAGASRVMLGSVLIRTVESAADLTPDGKGGFIKESRGSASFAAVRDRTAGRLSPLQERRAMVFVEGASGVKVPVNPHEDTVTKLTLKFMAGLGSAMSYSGCSSLEEFGHKAKFEVQTPAGFHEGTPHARVS